MLTDWTDKIFWKRIAFIDISADFTYISSHLLWCFWFWFDILLIIIITCRWYICQNFCIRYICNEHGMCSQIQRIDHLTANIGIGIPGYIVKSILTACCILIISKLIYISSRLETKMLKYIKGCLF